MNDAKEATWPLNGAKMCIKMPRSFDASQLSVWTRKAIPRLLAESKKEGA